MLRLIPILFLISTAFGEGRATPRQRITMHPTIRPHQPAGRPVLERGLLTRAVEGPLGGIGRCDQPSEDELRFIDSCTPSADIVGTGSQFDVIARLGKRVTENYIEDLFFQELAGRSHASTTCQLSLLNAYVQGDGAAQLNEAGYKIFHIAQPLMARLMADLNRKTAERNGVMQTLDPEHMDFSASEATNRVRRATLDSEIAGLERAINSLIAQIPMGSSDDVRDSIWQLVSENRVPSQAAFTSAYARGLTSLRGKMREADDFFRTHKHNNLYDLGRSEKIAFVQSGEAYNLLRQMDPQGRLNNKLTCRLRAQYETGPAAVQITTALALLAATVFTDGAASVIAMAGITAQAAMNAVHTCFGPTVNASSQLQTQACSPATVAASSLVRSSALACGVQAAIAGAGATILAPYANEFLGMSRSMAALSRSEAQIQEAFTASELRAMGQTAVSEARAGAAVAAQPEAEAEIVVTASRARPTNAVTLGNRIETNQQQIRALIDRSQEALRRNDFIAAERSLDRATRLNTRASQQLQDLRGMYRDPDNIVMVRDLNQKFTSAQSDIAHARSVLAARSEAPSAIRETTGTAAARTPVNGTSRPEMPYVGPIDDRLITGILPTPTRTLAVPPPASLTIQETTAGLEAPASASSAAESPAVGSSTVRPANASSVTAAASARSVDPLVSNVLENINNTSTSYDGLLNPLGFTRATGDFPSGVVVYRNEEGAEMLLPASRTGGQALTAEQTQELSNFLQLRNMVGRYGRGYIHPKVELLARENLPAFISRFNDPQLFLKQYGFQEAENSAPGLITLERGNTEIVLPRRGPGSSPLAMGPSDSRNLLSAVRSSPASRVRYAHTGVNSAARTGMNRAVQEALNDLRSDARPDLLLRRFGYERQPSLRGVQLFRNPTTGTQIQLPDLPSASPALTFTPEENSALESALRGNGSFVHPRAFAASEYYREPAIQEAVNSLRTSSDHQLSALGFSRSSNLDGAGIVYRSEGGGEIQVPNLPSATSPLTFTTEERQAIEEILRTGRGKFVYRTMRTPESPVSPAPRVPASSGISRLDQLQIAGRSASTHEAQFTTELREFNRTIEASDLPGAERAMAQLRARNRNIENDWNTVMGIAANSTVPAENEVVNSLTVISERIDQQLDQAEEAIQQLRIRHGVAPRDSHLPTAAPPPRSPPVTGSFRGTPVEPYYGLELELKVGRDEPISWAGGQRPSHFIGQQRWIFDEVYSYTGRVPGITDADRATLLQLRLAGRPVPSELRNRILEANAQFQTASSGHMNTIQLERFMKLLGMNVDRSTAGGRLVLRITDPAARARVTITSREVRDSTVLNGDHLQAITAAIRNATSVTINR